MDPVVAASEFIAHRWHKPTQSRTSDATASLHGATHVYDFHHPKRDHQQQQHVHRHFHQHRAKHAQQCDPSASRLDDDATVLFAYQPLYCEEFMEAHSDAVELSRAHFAMSRTPRERSCATVPPRRKRPQSATVKRVTPVSCRAVDSTSSRDPAAAMIYCSPGFKQKALQRLEAETYRLLDHTRTGSALMAWETPTHDTSSRPRGPGLSAVRIRNNKTAAAASTCLASQRPTLSEMQRACHVIYKFVCRSYLRRKRDRLVLMLHTSYPVGEFSDGVVSACKQFASTRRRAGLSTHKHTLAHSIHQQKREEDDDEKMAKTNVSAAVVGVGQASARKQQSVSSKHTACRPKQHPPSNKAPTAPSIDTPHGGVDIAFKTPTPKSSNKTAKPRKSAQSAHCTMERSDPLTKLRRQVLLHQAKATKHDAALHSTLASLSEQHDGIGGGDAYVKGTAALLAIDMYLRQNQRQTKKRCGGATRRTRRLHLPKVAPYEWTRPAPPPIHTTVPPVTHAVLAPSLHEQDHIHLESNWTLLESQPPATCALDNSGSHHLHSYNSPNTMAMTWPQRNLHSTSRLDECVLLCVAANSLDTAVERIMPCQDAMTPLTAVHSSDKVDVIEGTDSSPPDANDLVGSPGGYNNTISIQHMPTVCPHLANASPRGGGPTSPLNSPNSILVSSLSTSSECPSTRTIEATTTPSSPQPAPSTQETHEMELVASMYRHFYAAKRIQRWYCRQAALCHSSVHPIDDTALHQPMSLEQVQSSKTTSQSLVLLSPLDLCSNHSPQSPPIPPFNTAHTTACSSSSNSPQSPTALSHTNSVEPSSVDRTCHATHTIQRWWQRHAISRPPHDNAILTAAALTIQRQYRVFVNRADMRGALTALLRAHRRHTRKLMQTTPSPSKLAAPRIEGDPKPKLTTRIRPWRSAVWALVAVRRLIQRRRAMDKAARTVQSQFRTHGRRHVIAAGMRLMLLHRARQVQWGAFTEKGGANTTDRGTEEMVEDTRSQRHGGDDTRWDEYTDPETGAPYFYNPTTGETKWKQVETTTKMALQQPVAEVASDDGDYMIAGLATPSVVSTPRSPSSATSNHETTYARVDGGGTWTQAADENGCAYYYNTATNAMSWNPSSAQHPLLAMETWECFTSKDGVPYYYNALTGETTWTLPNM
ncbi:hypothetical protein, variant [Aphanomyces astaci]|uniref:WW domain-containing protein n=1 Tax=Aphanomyces astaci TaxID=112090 RepID=W4G1P3_APHAT|nr:hypothetical protein, variant [Aphanomyces astaci]ETV73622.1 hypothetical protein, variant [Aphanomyces astaci]|eukprot:XP_009837048.1 hypothetical protein, variant [Aphanomyces astaci]